MTLCSCFFFGMWYHIFLHGGSSNCDNCCCCCISWIVKSTNKFQPSFLICHWAFTILWKLLLLLHLQSWMIAAMLGDSPLSELRFPGDFPCIRRRLHTVGWRVCFRAYLLALFAFRRTRGDKFAATKIHIVLLIVRLLCNSSPHQMSHRCRNCFFFIVLRALGWKRMLWYFFRCLFVPNTVLLQVL